MTTDEAAKRRTRRAEPITKRTAKNGTVSYEFRADLGIKPDGSRDRRRFTYATQREARTEYRRITTEVAAGVHVARAKLTVGEHIEAWLDGRRDVRAVTLAGYRHALKPVVDRLGGLPLQQLTKKHVDDLVTWRLTQGRQASPPLSEAAVAILSYVAAQPDGVTYSSVVESHGNTAGKYLDRLRQSGHVIRPKRGIYVAATSPKQPKQRHGVSERTVTTMLVQFSAALEDAVEQGLVTRNVARLVERPKVTPSEMQTWTRNEVTTFRRHVRGQRLYACWLLSLCGLRRSEVLGLAWESIDFDAGTIAIVQGRVTVGSSETVIGNPKSARSRRVLPTPPDVITALRAFKVVQASERLALGSGYPDTGLVAVCEDGLPIRHEWYGDEFKRQATSAGVPEIRLHDARHSSVSLMLDAGIPVAAVAAWHGHDPAMTLRVYGHVYDDTLKMAGAALFNDGDEATG